jgi:diguanylate cyclase (GGDEF)-like protein
MKKKYKSKISSHIRNINILLLAVFIVLATIMVTAVVTDITSSASETLARLYSLEVVGKFSMHVNRDLALVQKASISAAITNWFADEENQEKKLAAYRSLMEFSEMLQNTGSYFVIHKTLHEYSIQSGTPFEELKHYDIIEPGHSIDAWYYDCISSQNDYTLYIDVNKITGERFLWINHKVFKDGNIVGAFASGLPFEELAQELFSHYDGRYVRGYIIDRNSSIKIDSHVPGQHLRDLNDDPSFGYIIKTYLANMDGYFDSEAQPVLVKLEKSTFKYVSIAPIAGSDWFVVIFFNNQSLFHVTKLMPLIIILLLAFFLYVIAERILMRRLVFFPLTNLTKSIPADNTETVNIYGRERDDELGELARTIQEMREGLIKAAKDQELLIRTDQLTQLPNRRYFDERLPTEWERAARTKTPLSILILDLDHFKDYNDTYGHLNGDRVLQATAKVFMREVKRPADFVARWGGEEFVVILADTDSKGAEFIAEHVRENIKGTDIELDDGRKTKITVSVGVYTVVPTKNETQNEFIRKADDALYRAKAEGRDRVCLYAS